MKGAKPNGWLRSNVLKAWPIALALATLVSVTVHGVTVTNFGFGSMRIHNALPAGPNPRPLLLIVANYAGDPALTNYDWVSLIFSAQGSNSLYQYYREVSNGRFSWTMADYLRVNFTNVADRMNRNSREEQIQEAQRQTGFNFRLFDANHDGIVTGDELSILIIQNLGNSGGQTGDVDLTVPTPPSGTIRLALKASGVPHTESLMTFCHEICHTLGAIDLYGNNESLHSGISLMGPTIASDSNRRSFHLDPWHKLVLGWSEPRIVSLRGNNRVILPAGQLGQVDAPVLLFDPVRGTEEFYLLEHRTVSTSAGGGFDRNVAQQGLLIWHIRQDATNAPVLGAPHMTLPSPAQSGWTFCKKCNGNFYRPGQGSSHCPAGATHEPYDEHIFSMVWNAPADLGQQNWRWCLKCQGMFYAGNAQPTRCPADNGSHDGSQSANYVIRPQSQRGNQRGWAWCRKCQALFYAGLDSNNNLLPANGVCPVPGQHDSTGSGEYSLNYDIYDVFNEAAPSNVLGRAGSWFVGDSTPFSLWFSDGSQVRVQYQPKAYLNGGDDLKVEWTSDLTPPPFSGETWVDYAGAPSGDGSFGSPYNLLHRAVDQSPFYTRIKLKPGSGGERTTIRQSVVLEAPLGRVTIGQ